VKVDIVELNMTYYHAMKFEQMIDLFALDMVYVKHLMTVDVINHLLDTSVRERVTTAMLIMPS
jgi:hypothetical protein